MSISPLNKPKWFHPVDSAIEIYFLKNLKRKQRRQQIACGERRPLVGVDPLSEQFDTTNFSLIRPSLFTNRQVSYNTQVRITYKFKVN